MYDHVKGMGVDPRGICQRIMDVSTCLCLHCKCSFAIQVLSFPDNGATMPGEWLRSSTGDAIVLKSSLVADPAADGKRVHHGPEGGTRGTPPPPWAPLGTVNCIMPTHPFWILKSGLGNVPPCALNHGQTHNLILTHVILVAG